MNPPEANPPPERSLLDDVFVDARLAELAANAWHQAELDRVAGLGQLSRDVLTPEPNLAAEVWADHRSLESPATKPNSRAGLWLLAAAGTVIALGFLFFLRPNPPEPNPPPMVSHHVPPEPTPPKSTVFDVVNEAPKQFEVVNAKPSKLFTISASAPTGFARISTEELDEAFGDSPWMLVCQETGCEVWTGHELSGAD